MKVNPFGNSLTLVKKRVCVRKQFLKKFGGCPTKSYLCIVNQYKSCLIQHNLKTLKEGLAE